MNEYEIERRVIELCSFSAQKTDHRPQLEGINISNGMAEATNGRILGTLPTETRFEGFLPAEVCIAALRGARRDHRFTVFVSDDGALELGRWDGVSLSIDFDGGSPSLDQVDRFAETKQVSRPDFPETNRVKRGIADGLTETIGINLDLLGQVARFRKRAKLPKECEMDFDGALGSIRLVSGDFIAYVMPVRL